MLSKKKIPLVCKDNIPVLIDMEILKNFTNLYKSITEDNKDEKILIDEIEVKTLNFIIEYIKLSNIIDINKNGIIDFIDKLEENMVYDMIIASKILGIPKLILDLGNKIRNLLDK